MPLLQVLRAILPRTENKRRLKGLHMKKLLRKRFHPIKSDACDSFGAGAAGQDRFLGMCSFPISVAGKSYLPQLSTRLQKLHGSQIERLFDLI